VRLCACVSPSLRHVSEEKDLVRGVWTIFENHTTVCDVFTQPEKKEAFGEDADRRH
jgi:hypothetical protein